MKPSPSRLREWIEWLRSLLPKAKPKPKPRPKPRPTPKPTPKPKPQAFITMYDSVDVSTVPPNPEAVAGYTGGAWPTYNALLKKFPKAKHISIAVAAREDAQCLDIEPGDAVAVQAPSWYVRQKARGVKYPKLYTSASNVNAVVAAMNGAGVKRMSYRVWSAHYGHGKHVCGPHSCGYPQADATQYDDRAMGRNLDVSLCTTRFFD